jgi:hypothetical protein
VTGDDPAAVDDASWFDTHPGRRYRVRSGWAVRRIGRVFLRAAILPEDRVYSGDSEGAAERIWWRAAHPAAPPEWRRQMAAESRARVKSAVARSIIDTLRRRGRTPPGVTLPGSWGDRP